MEILSLHYRRYLTNFKPEVEKEDSEILSKFNQDLYSKLKEKNEFYRLSIDSTKHLDIDIAYKTSEDNNLIEETNSLLEETAKETGLKGEGIYFALKSTRVVPFDHYKTNIEKETLNSILKK